MEILIISGLSGAGKSRAASFLEDMGFYIVDNMPAAMILKFAEFCAGGSQRYDKVALVYDVRTANSPTELFDVLDVLKHSSGACSLLFLEAEPETIIKRYKETRRRHPLMQQADSLEKAVRTEQEMMEPLRQRADVVIDTTHLSTAQLRGELLRHFGSDTTEKGGMSVTITSFGFKYGLPMEADLVFDVRCMPNPFYIPELREKTGLDQPVADYVFSFRQTHDFMEKLRDPADLFPPAVRRGGQNGAGHRGGLHRRPPPLRSHDPRPGGGHSEPWIPGPGKSPGYEPVTA